MRFRKFIPLLGFHLLVGAASGATIVSSVTDLSFTYSGGASQVSSSAGTLVIETSKNSSATAALPAAYQLGTVGSTLGLTFDFAFDNAMSDATSSFNIAFGDSSTAGGYEFFVRLNPVTTGNGITFSESDDTNLGKSNLDSAFGTTTHTVSFTLERVAAGTGLDALELAFSSPTLSATLRSQGNDITPLKTDVFDTFAFGFTGNGFNEEFPASSGNRLDATITNFSIATTGSQIPEPRVSMLLAIGMLSLLRRRRADGASA